MSKVDVADVSALEESGVAATDGASVFSRYSNRLSRLRTQLGVAQAARHRALLVIFASACVGASIFGLVAAHHAVALAWWAVPLLGAGFGLLRYLRSGALWRKIEKQREYFERGVLRLTAAWQGEGRTGAEFEREGHLYQSDLNILGEGSLFDLLCTTRSEFGAERLADYLLEPVSLDESRRRQAAVQELREGAWLREEMAMLGDFRAENCGSSVFEAWLEMPPIASPRRSRPSQAMPSSSRAQSFPNSSMAARAFRPCRWGIRCSMRSVASLTTSRCTPRHAST